MMALEVWFREDVKNVLLSAEQSTAAALQAAGGDDDVFTKGYQAGYRAALTTIALAFGLLQPGSFYGEQQEAELTVLTAVANDRRSSWRGNGGR